MPRSGLPIVGGVADAAGEKDEIIGVRCREHEILGIATHHAQSVDQHPNEEVGFAQLFAVLPGYNSTPDKPCQRLHAIGCPQGRVLVAMHELKVLDRIFNVDEPSGAMFHIDGSGLNELLQLLPPEVEGDGEIPRCAAVHVPIPMGFDLFSQRGISGDAPKLDHGLSLEGQRPGRWGCSS